MRRLKLLCIGLALSYLAILLVPTTQAGGPLVISGGSPIVWDTTNPIKYRIDPGKLGPIDETTIQASIKKAFKSWSDVQTASIKFQFDGVLDDDVTTFADYLIETKQETGGNVVILDDRGDIVAEIFGEGNRDRILGFASPIPSQGRISAFLSLMNGRLAVSAENFLSTLIHEFGHAIGLDHTQIHFQLANDGDQLNDRFIPTMYPTSSDDDTQLGSLNPDDVAWVSTLYPSQGGIPKFGRIRGRLVRMTAAGPKPVLGANVIAVLQSGAAEESRMNQFSCVSDYLKQNNGEFVIPVVAGSYKLHIEPIRRGFTGGSSVGPYSEKSTSPSFLNPVDPSDHLALINVVVSDETNIGDIPAN